MSGIHPFLDQLKADPSFMQGVRMWKTFDAKPARFADFPEDLHPQLIQALRSRGVEQLYSHQAQSFSLLSQGRHALVVTPTASGKTLCYNLPVTNAILARPESRALYLFPTKALSQDQQSELNELSLGAQLGIKIATYDGDTPQSIRASARETGQIIISNPDMLHSGVLPNHPKWIKFFRNLRYIVLDEVHTYSGVFGSHMANLMRRLRRVCAFYGSRPQFICCSATIGNPLELAQRVLGLELSLVDESGAPGGKKHLILYNPPLVDPVQGIRRGTVNESQKIAIGTLQAGIKTIVFARSRVRVELIANYIKSSLADHFTGNQGIRVESYRGGYLPNERRMIEKGLRDGSIQGVVSTNALELGIDIGGLDAAILAGFPGSVSSVWQQAGRAGRRNSESLAIVVSSSSPLDQYLVEHPEYFLGRSPEQAFINPLNPAIYLDHVKCAAFELPFDSSDAFFEHPDTVLDYLVKEGVLRKTAGRWFWSNQSYPAEGISLRGADARNVVIIDASGGKNEVIGEMDVQSAKELVFPEAVYLHRGRQFMVHELDLSERRCVVKESTVNYYTDAVVKRDLKVLSEDEDRAGPGVSLSLGDVLVRSQVSKYKKLKFHTHENLGYGEIFLPEDELHTRFAVLVMKPGCRAAEAFDAVDEALKTPVIARLGSLFKAVAPAFLLCQSSDFGVAERLRDPHFGVPCLYLYDRVSGGAGIAEALVRVLPEILAAARERVMQCSCTQGCPSCVGPRNPDEEPGIDPKTGMQQFLGAWLEQEPARVVL